MSSFVVTTNLGHDTHRAEDHFESPERVNSIVAAVKADSGLSPLLYESEATCGDEDLLLAHGRAYLTEIATAAARGNGWFDADTYFTAFSDTVARQAVAATLEAVDRVCLGHANGGFAVVRPPGHHAETHVAQGFCLYNNVAVAARRAQRLHGIGRVAIVDIDVHHGNGTEAIFADDPTIRYISLHQTPLYPGTGLTSRKNCFNFPLPPGTDGDAWLQVFTAGVLPAIREFAPELILVSAGFDGHQDDPLGGLRLDAAAYARAAKELGKLATEIQSRGPVWVLEGGYAILALVEAATAVMRQCATD